MKKYSLWKDWYLMTKEEEKMWLDDAKEFWMEGAEDDEEEPDYEQLQEECIMMNNDYFDDLMNELKRYLDNAKIKVYANLGLWYGNKECNREFKNIKNAISECCEDYNEIYEDRYGNLYMDAYHHDGCNTFLFKKIIDGKEQAIKYRKNVLGV